MADRGTASEEYRACPGPGPSSAVCFSYFCHVSETGLRAVDLEALPGERGLTKAALSAWCDNVANVLFTKKFTVTVQAFQTLSFLTHFSLIL